MDFKKTKIAFAVVVAMASGVTIAAQNDGYGTRGGAGAVAGNGDWNITSAASEKIQIEAVADRTLKITADGFTGATSYGAVTNYAVMGGDDVMLSLSVKDSIFQKNTASRGAALVLFSGAQSGDGPDYSHTIADSKFLNNTVTDRGGAVVLLSDNQFELDGTVTFANSRFAENKVVATEGGSLTARNQGGAIYGEGTNVVIASSEFEDNAAYNGGAIALSEGTELDITGSVFKGNSADFRGGAIFTDGTSEISIDGAQFINNQSGDTGGAIAISNFAGATDPVTIKNTLFKGNEARRKGGALVIFNMEEELENANKVTLENVEFRNNRVTDGVGGAIMVEESVTIRGSALFEGNSAAGEEANGGAIYAENGASMTIDATEEADTIVFTGNTVNGEANDVYVAEGSNTELTGKGAIVMNSGLAGAGSITSSAADVYVGDVSKFTGDLTIDEGVFSVDAGKYLDTTNQVFGTGATVTVNEKGELHLDGVNRSGTIQLVDETGSVTGSNISYDNGFLTGSIGEDGLLTIDTNTDVIANGNFGDDTELITNNLDSLFARGASQREQKILTEITDKYIENGALSKRGADAFRQATGGSATAGAFNVAYDAQTQFTDSIVRHQLNEHRGYGVWADVYYTSNQAKTLYGNSGYETDIYGGVLGFDATFSCGATAGIALTVGTGDTDTVGELSSQLDTDFYGLSLYMSKDFAGFNALLDFGYMKFNNDFSGLGDAGDVDAMTVGLRGDFKAYTGEVLSIVPHIGLRYTHLESDEVAFNDETSLDIVEAPIGVAFKGNFEVQGWNIVPALDLSIVPQLADKDVDTFSGTVDVIDNLYNTTLGIAATYRNLTFGLDYRYGFGSEDRDNNSVNLKVRYSF